MPTVQNTIHRPIEDAAPPTDVDASVVIELVGSNGARVAGYAGTTSVVEGVSRPAVDANGSWEAILTANSLLTPTGTQYKITERVDDRSEVAYITVPDTPGTYSVRELLTDGPPASLPSPALQDHLDDAEAAHSASAVAFDPTAAGLDPAIDNVQAALDAVAAGRSLTALDPVSTLDDGDLFLVTQDPTGTPISRKATGGQLRSLLSGSSLGPTGAIAETIPRQGGGFNASLTTGLASGTLRLSAIKLFKGQVVTSISSTLR